MRISIITADGETRIEEEISDDCIFSPQFEVETSDYLIQVSNNGDYYISNAMNGYGHNCREVFKDAAIEIYK